MTRRFAALTALIGLLLALIAPARHGVVAEICGADGLRWIRLADDPAPAGPDPACDHCILCAALPGAAAPAALASPPPPRPRSRLTGAPVASRRAPRPFQARAPPPLSPARADQA